MDIFSKDLKVTWEKLSPLPVCRSAHTAVLLGGVIYVGGGFEGRSDEERVITYRLDAYNLITNQWSTSPIITPCSEFAMTVLDEHVIIAGGIMKNYEVIGKVYYLHAGKWENYSEMPTARYYATAVGYQSRLIIVGGITSIKGEWITLSTVELLDPLNGHWYKCSNLPSPHAQLTSVVVDGTLYLLGGRGQNGSSSQVFAASLHTLSTQQLNWQSLPDTPWCASSFCVLYNKYLMAVGGRKQSDNTTQTSEIHAFNPTTGLWVHVTDIPTGRSRAAVVGVAENKVICAGGAVRSSDRKFSDVLWIGTFE